MKRPVPSSYAAQRTMQANRRADTAPELAVRRALHAIGLRFRKDYMVRTPDGTRCKVDVVFTRARVAVFVDGCFWHGCPQHGRTPKANADYWGPKLTRNRERDERVSAALAADDWTVLRCWEHEPVDVVAARVEAAVRGTSWTAPPAGRSERVPGPATDPRSRSSSSR